MFSILAYLDPGSASALLAAVLAGLAGIGAAVRTFGYNLKNTLIPWKKDKPESTEPERTEETK